VIPSRIPHIYVFTNADWNIVVLIAMLLSFWKLRPSVLAMEADVSFFLHSNCTGELVYGEVFSASTSLPCELVSQRRIASLAVEAVSFSSAPTPTNSPASPLGYSATVERAC